MYYGSNKLLGDVVRRAERIKPHKIEAVDEHAKTELDLYLENTSELYNQKLSILTNIRRRLDKGTFDVSKVYKLWMYWVDRGARMYVKEFGIPGQKVSDLGFNKATRTALARELALTYASGHE
jgi:hypothetical protein